MADLRPESEMPLRHPILPFLLGGGEMGALIRAHDWKTTSIGEPDTWPASLRTCVMLLLNAEQPMYIWWGPELLCFYNDAYRRSIGSERHPGSMGRPGREVWSEIWDVIGPQIDHVLAGRGSVSHENALVPITRNGRLEQVYWTYSYNPILDSNSPAGVGGILIICTETTEKVLSGQREAAERRQLAELFEQSPSFMTMLRGPEHRFELANPNYLSLIGNRQIIGRTVAEALPETVSQGYLELLDEVFRSGKPYRAISARYAPQAAPGGIAEQRYLDFVYQPILDSSGAVTGIFVEGVDVTTRKTAEAQLRELNERLEQRVAEALAERAEAEKHIRHTQKIDAIGQLTGGVAHDFNNLLMVISGGLSLLQRSEDIGRQQRIIDQMRQAADRGASLSRQLLTFARRQALKAEPLDLHCLIDGMLEMLDRTLRGNIQVKTKLADDLWPIKVDRTEFELVILNLCVNARDAMPDGGIITICAKNAARLREHELSGDFVVLSVEDTGSGIPADVLARVFEPFFTTKEIGKGSGLGLPQVYGFAQQSGGSVKIDSKVGVGTTATLLLPRSDVAPAAPSPENDGLDSTARRRALRGCILLVEDDDGVAVLVAEMLSSLGYRVTRVASARAALGALADDPGIDLVFSDILMPGPMTGVDLAREVRRRRPGAPILLTSGYAGAALKATDIDDIQILFKPYQIGALDAALREALGKSDEARGRYT